MATIPDTDRAARGHIVDCTRCARGNVDGAWLAESDAVRGLRTYDQPEPPRFASTVCPHCLAYLGVRPAAVRGPVTASGD